MVAWTAPSNWNWGRWTVSGPPTLARGRLGAWSGSSSGAGDRRPRKRCRVRPGGGLATAVHMAAPVRLGRLALQGERPRRLRRIRVQGSAGPPAGAGRSGMRLAAAVPIPIRPVRAGSPGGRPCVAAAAPTQRRPPTPFVGCGGRRAEWEAPCVIKGNFEQTGGVDPWTSGRIPLAIAVKSHTREPPRP